jgi:hypothetical protein
VIGEGPHTSEWTNSKGYEVVEEDRGKGSLWAFATQQSRQTKNLEELQGKTFALIYSIKFSLCQDMKNDGDMKIVFSLSGYEKRRGKMDCHGIFFSTVPSLVNPIASSGASQI